MKALIIGGTGTLGRALTREILKSEHTEVTCFSRDELKQKIMAKEFDSERLRFVIGDVRDLSALTRAMRGAHIVFHVAALKHVDTMEENPEESVKTNILGTMNVADAAEAAGVPFVVFSSTDKAVDCLNVYGSSKAIAEQILFRRNATQKKTRFSVYRWGNVLGSRGSVIPAFAGSLRSRREIVFTDSSMTRYWLKIEDAARFMIETYAHASESEAMIPPMKAASVGQIAYAVAAAVGVGMFKTKTIPIRPGEKMHEMMRSIHSANPMCSQTAEQYTTDELVELIRGCV
jgi:UDP-N-acetylglucosamine 4,6-dehydratase/5-epimerase